MLAVGPAKFEAYEGTKERRLRAFTLNDILDGIGHVRHLLGDREGLIVRAQQRHLFSKDH